MRDYPVTGIARSNFLRILAKSTPSLTTARRSLTRVDDDRRFEEPP